MNDAIPKLRQALNDDADHPHYIETLAKIGYRFVAPVVQAGDAPQAAGKADALSTATAAVKTNPEPPFFISCSSSLQHSSHLTPLCRLDERYI